MIGLLLLIADLQEFGNSYADIGIVDVKEIRVPEEDDIRECEEEDTWRELVRQTRIVTVVPKEERVPIQVCQGHSAEVPHVDKKRIWFKKRDTVDQLVARTQATLDQNPELDHGKSKAYAHLGDKDLWCAKTHIFHRNDSKICTSCAFDTTPPDGEGWEVTPVFRCLGHDDYKERPEGKKKLRKYSQAKKRLDEVANAFRNDRTIAASTFSIHEYEHEDTPEDLAILGSFRHVDTYVCNNQAQLSSYCRPEQIIEEWSNEGATNPSCRLIQSTESLPETRTINGAQVKLSWQKMSAYDCGSRESADCKELRGRGGSLIGKKCSKGRCTKTYDMDQWAPYSLREYTFRNSKPIYGFNGEFDHLRKYKKKCDFAQVFGSILGAADSCTSKESWDEDRVYEGHLTEGELFREDERCYYIGFKERGGELIRVQCCFKSKIARILQEGAKKGKWGTPEQPDCSALRKEEISELLETADLSETYVDLIDPQLAQKIQNRLSGVGKES